MGGMSERPLRTPSNNVQPVVRPNLLRELVKNPTSSRPETLSQRVIESVRNPEMAGTRPRSGWLAPSVTSYDDTWQDRQPPYGSTGRASPIAPGGTNQGFAGLGTDACSSPMKEVWTWESPHAHWPRSPL
ncbi:hypothetical protein GCM10010199_31060 [Dactylosporangium roseum]